MKKFWKKIAVLLAVTVVLASVDTSEAYAASELVIHAKDGANWGTVNIYNWGDAGEIAGAWPGTEMTEEGDGWYTYTLETDYNLNLVFSAEGGAPQTIDVNDVNKDGGEVWVVIGGDSTENPKGISAVEAVLYTTPEDGWPTIAAEENATADTSADTSSTTVTDTPKTGEGAPVKAITYALLAAFTVGASALLKKKQNSNI